MVGRGRGPASSRRRSRVFPNAIDANCHHTQVAYFGWYQMHASQQSRKMKEYYEQNPTTGEQMGEGVAVPGSD